MTIQEIHDFIDLVTDKDQTGYFTHEEKDSVLDRASMWWFNKWSPVYAESAEAFEALSPFKTKLDYETDSGGVYTVSADQKYMRVTGMDVSVLDEGSEVARRWPVEFLREDEIASRLNSQLLAPSNILPIAEKRAIKSGTVGLFTHEFSLYPAQVHAGTLRFLRRPAKPVFSYTQDGEEITYSAEGSTQLEWTEPYINKVIAKALQFLGISLKNPILEQAGITLPQEDV
jgi:hypothetical protein